MATVKVISSKAGVKNATNYILNPEKTRRDLLFSKDCSIYHPKEEMGMVKSLYNKKDGRTYQHFVLSFHKDEEITPQQVKSFAEELISRTEMFRDFQVIGAVHTDTAHKHAHFIVNSVSYVDGHKFHRSQKDLQDLKELCNEICIERGLTVNKKGRTFQNQERVETTSFKKETYHAIIKGEQGQMKSWVWDIAVKVSEVYDLAKDRDEFIKELSEQGVQTSWTNRKYIIFTDKDGNKIRNKKLQEYFNFDVSKEGLENEFTFKREQQEFCRTIATERARPDYQEPEKDIKQERNNDTGTTVENNNSQIADRESRRRKREFEYRKSEFKKRNSWSPKSETPYKSKERDFDFERE